MGWLRTRLEYTREGLGVLGELMADLITVDEATAEITRLRRKYGLKDKP